MTLSSVTRNRIVPTSVHRTGQRLSRRQIALDCCLAATWIAIACLEYAFPYDDGFRGGSVTVSLVLSIALLLPLAARRLAPILALTASCAALALPSVLVPHTFLFWGGEFPLLFLFYTVWRHRPWRVAVYAIIPVAVALPVYFLRMPEPGLPLAMTSFGIVLGVGGAVGAGLRYAAQQRDQLSDILAELELEEIHRERFAVLDQRTQVARDLHDVVAHAVSLMLLQAGAARLAIDDDPATVRQFLAGVEKAGHAAIADLDNMVGMLRTTDEGSASVQTTGLAGVADLVASMRAAGLDIHLRVDGSAPVLAPGLDLAAFRILQEALTNVLKHAGASVVALRIRYGATIEFSIVDDGPHGERPAQVTSGHGLVGMRERVQLFGGDLRLGPAGFGFAVHVQLPVPGAP
jgi:signal transduction histidine kinase